MIRVQDLCYEVEGHQILNHISLEIQSGEKVALIGPSGAGKSSFLSILIKKIESITGDVFIQDTPLSLYSNNKLLANEIGMISQNFELIESLSVKSNILMGHLKNWSFFQSLKEIFFKDHHWIKSCRILVYQANQNKKWPLYPVVKNKGWPLPE